MSEVATSETKAELGRRLARLIEEALGTDAFPNPDGWRFDGFTLRAMRGGDNRVEDDISPVVHFALPERRLSIAVMAREAEKPAYFRSAHYDISYSVESVEDSQRIYELDRATIDVFCSWVVSWDGAEASAADAPAAEAPQT